MAIIPSTNKEIFFNISFSESNKKNICQSVFDKIKELQITELYDLKYNYSSEGGVELPKTYEWMVYLNTHPDERTRDIHNYQSTRQLRFIIVDNNIIGARCKDYINIFTDLELIKITMIFNHILL
jgi:hypothetical protein